MKIPYFEKYPNAFRMVIGMIVLGLICLGVYNLYYTATIPSNKHLFRFRSSMSNWYITESFHAHLENDHRDGHVVDSVKVGDLLLTVNGLVPQNESEIVQALDRADGSSKVELTIFRTVQNTKITYLVDKDSIPNQFLRQISNSVYIVDIIADGASEHTGVRKGDIVLKINDRNFTNAKEAVKIVHLARSDQKTRYDILRNNEEITLEITPVKFGLQTAMLILWFSGLLYIIIGTFIIFKSPHIRTAGLLGMSFIFLGFFLMAVYSSLDYSLITKIFFATAVASAFLGIGLKIHSSYYFPIERSEILTKNWLTYLPYIIAITFIPILLIDFYKFKIIFLIGLAMIIFYKLGVDLVFYKHRSAEYIKMNRTVKWTTGISLSISFFMVYTMFISGNQFQIGFIGIPLAFIPFAYLYTIGHYQLLNLNIRIQRNIQYMIVTSVWVILLVYAMINMLFILTKINFDLPNIRFTGTSIEFIDIPIEPQYREFTEKIILMVITIGLTLVFWKAVLKGRHWFSKIFHRVQYDYRSAVGELAEVMSTKLTMIDLAQGIVEKMTQLMNIKRAGVLFFRNQTMCCCLEAYGFEGNMWKEFCMVNDKRILEVLQQFRSETRFSIDYLPSELKENFDRHGFKYIIPIRSKEKLVGILLIGKKQSDEAFQPEDLAFLSSASKQAAVSIENAFLYEELAGQERLKHELEIARRIQLASLPQITPKVDGLDISGISIPAMEVGGDYFDYLNGDISILTIIVGDVSGKGTSAALYMSKAQGILRTLHGFGLSPRELFIRANQLLYQDIEKKSFITAIGADFDAKKRQVKIARAGHLPLFHFQFKTKKVDEIEPKGIGLGLDNEGIFDNELEEKVIKYGHGDIFLFITDGITEARNNEGFEYGNENLINILNDNHIRSAAHIQKLIIDSLNDFVGSINQHDDQTLVVVKAV